MYLDADTHVDESEDTWSYIPKSAQEFVPRTLEFAPEQVPEWLSSNRSSGSGYYRFWFINGEIYPRRVRSDERTGTTLGTRELSNVKDRLRDMDRLGVETQVLYPTVFLDEISRRAEVQTVLYRSYNQWISDRCKDSSNRLQWIAMIPYTSMDAALKEIRFAKENGACGLFKLGTECERPASDPYFWPAYQLAAEVDLPVCIHQGSPWSAVPDPFATLPLGSGGGLVWPVIQAFSSLLHVRFHDRIPNLRIAFVEAGSAWLPYVFGLASFTSGTDRPNGGQTLAELGFYVTCETFEDIPYLTKIAGGDDNFVIGSDYTHGDRSSVIDAHKRIVDRTDLSETTKLKLTRENVRSLYRI